MSSNQRITEMNAYYAVRMTNYDQPGGGAPEGWVTDELVDLVKAALAGRDVLEVACGTGLWTGWLAPVAVSICATDYNEPALEIARRKPYPEGKVRFQQADAYALSGVPDHFTGGFCCDWWSHIPKSKRSAFLRAFNGRLRPGARVLIVDQRYWPAKHEFQDEEGNQIQRRKLPDGRTCEVVKNFPSREELLADLETWGAEIEYRTFENCGPNKAGRWCVSYTKKP